MLIDKTLDHRYTVLEHIGGGGMADVYKAHDDLLDRDVAVKILKSQFTNDEDFVRRFRREAQAAAKVSHANIVNIYDVGKDEEVYYIVMEYIPGETLKDKINREAPFSVELALQIALQISEALEHAHNNDLVHCDIKPHNILISKTGKIKVTDFGIARAVTSTTMTNAGTIIGSVHYLAPEQAKGGIAGPRSDLYSLGVVLYEMLAGNVPFSGESPIAIALQHLQQDPVPLHEINQAVPPFAQAIVMKAMQKDIEKRYQTTEEIIHDIKLALSYFKNDQTRRMSREDFPTMILPKLPATEGMNQPVKDDKKRKKGYTIPVLITLLLLLGFGIGAFLSFGKFWSAVEVDVPNIVGKPVDQARSILLEKRLKVSISGEAFSDKYPAGYVISQTPTAGAAVKESRTITIVLSRGGEATVVPDVRGMTVKQAELQLQGIGVKLGRTEEVFSDSPANTIVGQNPRPGVTIQQGTSLDISVSKGPSARKLTVPDFRGLTIAAVKNQIESLKLKVGKMNEVPSAQYPPGTVIEQSPAPGAEIQEGSAVDLNVSKSAIGAVKRGTVQVTVPEGPAQQLIQIFVVDSNGKRLVYEGNHKPGDRIERVIEGSGDVKVQVYINKALLQEQAL